MKKEAVLHIPLSEYAYALDEHTLNIRIRVAKNDIKKCLLFYGDRVDINKDIRTEMLKMKKTASDEFFDYFEVEFYDQYTRVCYYFLLDDGNEKLYYYSRGFCQKLDADRTEYFQFPYIRREDIFDAPDWATSVVMYHIFPDSFASGKNAICKEEKTMRLQNGRESHSRLGGTLKGIEENLPYLNSLGVNCIYINPVFSAESYHKYDTVDYYSVDPCFGNNEDLKRLVKKSHERGIRVILDGVFNHCGSGFFAFLDVQQNGQDSKYYDWFYHMPTPVEFKDPPNYEAFAYVKEMPKLNTGNPEVIRYFCDVGQYWLREADIDGWRLDVANEINHDFWRAYRKAVRKEKKDCLLIGEIWEDANEWLRGDQFDSTMNYTFSYLCKDFFAERKLLVSEFDLLIQKMLMRYRWDTDFVQMNFLDTHDIPRFYTYCDGDENRLILAFGFMMTMVGIPSVFYGDEFLLTGEAEGEYRKAMPWGKTKNPGDVWQTLCRLIQIRKENECLRKGKYKSLIADDESGLFAFERYLKSERLIILMNTKEKSMDATVYLPMVRKTHDLLGDVDFDERVVLEGKSIRILRDRK